MTFSNTHSDGYLALPKAGRGPGVLVLPAWWGLNAFFKGLCRRLAGRGFVALAPDLYGGEVAATVDEAKRLRAKLNQREAAARLVLAVEVLHKLEVVTGPAVGVVGFSMGARFALELSTARPRAVGAVVAFYGTSQGDYTPARAAYQGHFAETDPWQAVSGVKKLEKSLNAAGRPVTFYSYPGTGHWFFEKDRADAYDAPAARLAWQRTVKFLQATLATEPD
jgi:carboxymethylenebutenolidase